MKIKLDENLPSTLVGLLSAMGHDVDTVQQEGLQGRRDEQVWERAQADGRLLITQDLDFSDVRQLQPGAHHGVVLVRLHAPGRQALARRVQLLFLSEPGDVLHACLVVISESKTRVRRPTATR